MYFRPKTREELCVEKIEQGIRGIKMGIVKPEDAKVGLFLAKLMPLNEMMYQDLLAQYVVVKKEYDRKNYDKSKY